MCATHLLEQYCFFCDFTCGLAWIRQLTIFMSSDQKVLRLLRPKALPLFVLFKCKIIKKLVCLDSWTSWSWRGIYCMDTAPIFLEKNNPICSEYQFFTLVLWVNVPFWPLPFSCLNLKRLIMTVGHHFSSHHGGWLWSGNFVVKVKCSVFLTGKFCLHPAFSIMAV